VFHYDNRELIHYLIQVQTAKYISTIKIQNKIK
jgi:hypothetical protein